MPTIKNLEYTIHERVIYQLKNIDGSANYNFKLMPDYIYDEFKFPEDMVGSPSVCFGDWVNGGADLSIRNLIQIPFTWTIWGYINTGTDLLGEALKLLSDIRIAIAGGEHLNNLITGFGCVGEASAYDRIGVVRFEVSGVLPYDLT